MRILRLFKVLLILLIIQGCTYLRETPSYREAEWEAWREARNRVVPAESAEFYTEYSQLLGYELNGNENPELIREVVSWLGTPYRYGGINKSGADCSGFAKVVYRDVYGINLERVTVNMAQNSRRISKRNLQEGDLVFFRINSRRISHVGIYLSNNKFIHASASRGVVVNDLDEDYYSRRFAFGGRVGR
ncbi:MAG: NlpC/P60 family protein [Bacteroidetes bacterium]|nr:MAG: NlpC/P60 family protein [Bacteroidota bacterium]